MFVSSKSSFCVYLFGLERDAINRVSFICTKKAVREKRTAFFVQTCY
jgi:hypothetical protein